MSRPAPEPRQDALPQGPAYLAFVLLTSLLGIAVLAAHSWPSLDAEVRSVLDRVDAAICVLFFADFVITLARAPNRVRYFVTWGWLDLVSCVPMVPALRAGRLARLFRVLRVLRGVRSVRVLARWLLEHRAQGAGLTATFVALLLVLFGSIAILEFERVPGANIKGADDALWWSVVTLTTVGYGDRYPVTPEGRVVAVVLMLAGVGLFGTLSGFVAAWFISPAERDQDDDLRALREEVRSLRRLLERRDESRE